MLSSELAEAQVFTIQDGNITTCSGAFLDSGGQGASGYSNNESYVATICPDVPGDAITVTFPTFNLSTQGPQPIDALTIYDGNSTSAPSIGSYTGTELQGLQPTATFFNTSGCLTFEFNSNGAGTGVFAGSITCYTPCQPPVAVATMSEGPVPALVCTDEVIDFSGLQSTATAPFNVISWEWDFDDGTPPVQGATASHSFSEPGEYIVQLEVLDDNGCTNVNLVDLQVLVSTTPSFAGTVEAVETCLGATVDLTAVVSPTTWTGLPEANFGNGIYVADDPGSCFNNGLPYSAFDSGQTLTDINDLTSVCVSMEHSYMGDLIISVICPSGQSVILHQQGGGGTYIGDALDGETNPPTPGTCWDYCWSPTATNGTWVDNSGGTLPSGTYESLNPMSALVGCPLNGTWTLQICDMWGLDDGFVCSWTVNFDPSIIPEATQFTPDLGTSTLDSASWSGPYLTLDPSDPLHAIVNIPQPGNYSYLFTVSDNFGCNYDTTITVTIDPQVVIDAGPDITLCNDPVPMAAQVTANWTPGITWQWSPTDGLVDPSDPQTDVFVTSPTMFYLEAYAEGNPACAVHDSVMVYPDQSVDAGEDATLLFCAAMPDFLMTDSLGGTPDAGGTWTSSNGTVVPGVFDPETGVTDVYTYTMISVNGCEVTSQLDITVIPADDPTCCGVATCGPSATSCDLTNTLSVDPGNTGVGEWSGPTGAVFQDANATVTTVTLPPGMGGTHWFYWIEDDGAFCYLKDSVQMTFTDTILIDFNVTDATCYTWCDGESVASITGGNAAIDFLFDWSTGDHGFGTDQLNGLCADTYSLQVTDDNGCIGMNSFTVSEPVLLEIDSLASQPVTCSGDCDGQVEVYDPEAVDYSYDDGDTWGTLATLPDACEAIYTVRIRNAAGCVGIDNIEVTGPPPVMPDFTWNPIPANVDDPRIWFSNTSTGAQSYWWDIAGLATSTELQPYFRFSEKEPGDYLVCLAAFNYNNCTDTICKVVTIDDVLFTYIPNSFTPDGDDLNETWGMSTNIDVITNFEMRVFDRWGQVVFESENPAEWWNGAANNSGEILGVGVYVYRIAYEIRQTEVKKELFGSVTLVK
ncbi:MAG: gliding motility-associated C-terminal domain-containing protein [Flavobacteriales bacterium]|nr:gliding motility-associated C-terminal domain-containing protein [Flavobacteriales bacterium]